MKLLKIILFGLFILAGFTAFAQINVDKANKAMKKGIKLYNKKKFLEAKSLLTESINLHPQNDAFYYLALTGLQLNDTCGYCNNLDKAGFYGYMKAGKSYDSVCLKRTRTDYNGVLNSEFKFYMLKVTEVCSEKSYQGIHIKNLKNDKISSFSISGYDSLAVNDMNFFVKYPEFLDINSDKIVFTIAEVMPEYIGGDEARINFLGDNLHYPIYAKETGIMGTVYVSFIIEKDGSVSSAKILRGIGGGCDEEVIRIVNLMPKWKHGKCNGVAVRVQFNMPVKFTLN